MASIVSVNVGIPQELDWNGKTISTAINKKPVAGRVFAGHLNLEGDAQADLVGHGGEHRALMFYQIESYAYWKDALGLASLQYGEFGENVTIEGLADEVVCIGDRYQIGTTIVEVTQPRVTCYKLGAHFNRREMPALLVAHRRPGFYCRVIVEGVLGAGDAIEKVMSGAERMTVADINALFYTGSRSEEALQRALRIGALSPGWVSSIQKLLRASHAGFAGNAASTGHVTPPPWHGFKPLKVEHTTQVCDDVRSIEFGSVDNSALPEVRPGQHIVVNIDVESVPISRSYSVVGKMNGRYEIAVKRERPGQMSGYIHDVLKVGDILDASAPRGLFHMADSKLPVVLISAGIGLTPLLPMLERACSESDRDVFWFHVARDRSHHAYAARVAALIDKSKRTVSCVAYSRPESGLQIGSDYDVAGRLNVETVLSRGTPKLSEFYLCGPSSFMEDIQRGLTECGIDIANIYCEKFGSSLSSSSKHVSASRKMRNVAEDGPVVTFTRSGLTVRWSSHYRSLLELAEAYSVPVRWSCRAGVCHTCECGVVDGAFRYFEEPLEPPNEGRVLVCCAIPISEISLEL